MSIPTAHHQHGKHVPPPHLSNVRLCALRSMSKAQNSVRIFLTILKHGVFICYYQYESISSKRISSPLSLTLLYWNDVCCQHSTYFFLNNHSSAPWYQDKHHHHYNNFILLLKRINRTLSKEHIHLSPKQHPTRKSTESISVGWVRQELIPQQSIFISYFIIKPK